MLGFNDMNYVAYLRSFKWKLIVQHMIRKYKCCQLCKSSENLVVHHINYKRYPFEQERDLVLLCKDCHHKHHQKHKSGFQESSGEVINYLNELEKEDEIFNLAKISKFLKLKKTKENETRNKRKSDREDRVGNNN